MFIKKILILKSDSGKNSGVLRITANGNDVEGALTLNFIISSPLSLILNVGETHEIPVLENECKFKLNTEFSGEAHCLLLENEKPLLYGSTNNDLRIISELRNEYKIRKTIVSSPMSDSQSAQPNSNNQNEPKSQVHSQGKEPNSQAKPQPKTNPQNPKVPNSTNMYAPVKDRVMSQNSEPTVVINEGISYSGENFYIAVKPQLDEMFECYPSEVTLEKLISDSKWVRVDCDDEYYVVGLIFDENGKPEFICYGIPGTYPVKPPEEISDVCEWFPIDLDNKFGEGFWLIYQNALNGKCLKNA